MHERSSEASIWADAARVLESALGDRGRRRQLGLAVFLRDHLRADACQVLVRSPEDRRFVEVARVNYAPATAMALEREFPRSKWIHSLGDPWLPPSVSTEPSQAFRNGTFFRTHLEAAGFRDGLTAPIGDRIDPTAIVHLSSARDRHFGEAERATMADLGPVIQAYLAPLQHYRSIRSGASETYLRLHGDTVVTTDGSELPPELSAPESRDRLRQLFHLSSATQPADAELESPDLLRGMVSLGGVWHEYRHSVAGVAMVRALPGLPAGLTPREFDVLTLVTRGETDAAISELLVVSLRTVHAHMRSLMVKLGCPTRTRVAIRAIRAGWYDLLPELHGS